MPDQKHRPTLSPSDERLWWLTTRALEAAERGDWTSVQTWYREREAQLAFASASGAVAGRLLEVDAIITDKLGLAKAAIGQLLSETATVRRQMARMDGRQGGSVRVGATLNRES